MSSNKLRISAKVFENTFTSYDAGKNWKCEESDLPKLYAPIMQGFATTSLIPFELPNVKWDFIYLGNTGFGVAVNHRTLDSNSEAASSIAEVYVKNISGDDWQKISFKMSITSKLKSMFSFPVEKFDSLLVTQQEGMLLAWEDPWIFERSKSHILVSSDYGNNWNYTNLGNVLPNLYSDNNNVFLFHNNRFMISSDLGVSWVSKPYQLDIEIHTGELLTELQCVQFIEEGCAYGLINLLDNKHVAKPKQTLLVHTQDSCRTWTLVHRFEIQSEKLWENPRHALSLSISE